jgi:hypothetical protein
MNEIKDDYDQEVVEAIAKTIDETPMAQVDVGFFFNWDIGGAWRSRC